MTRTRRATLNLLLLCASLLAGLLLFEICARVAGVSYPVFQTHDVRRGFALRPHAAGWWRREGEAYVRINSDGLRDGEHTKAKPENTVRIAILGDSYAEARSVAVENTFWSVVERQLAKCSSMDGQTIEVINFGVTDYGTAQQLLTLRHHSWEYDPDLVLLAFFSDNDVRNNSAALEPKKYRPFFKLIDGQLTLDNSFRESRPYKLLSSWTGRFVLSLSDYLISVQVAREVFVRWFLGRRSSPADGAQAAKTDRPEAKPDRPAGEQGLDTRVYIAPPEAAWNGAWQVTEALITEMAKETSEHGSEFLMVTLSSGLQTHPDPKVRQKFASALGMPDLHYPERRLTALAEDKQFDILTLAPLLREYAEKENVFVHGFANTELGTGHWNEVGHRVAGNLIADHICHRSSDALTKLPRKPPSQR